MPLDFSRIIVPSAHFSALFKQFLHIPLGRGKKSWGWAPNDFCFTIAEISYIVVNLFHDLVQTSREDIGDTKFLQCASVFFSQNRIKCALQYCSGGFKGNKGNASLPPAFLTLGFVNLFINICLEQEFFKS